MADEPQVGMNWQCPYCGHHQVVLKERCAIFGAKIANDFSELGPTAIYGISIACANAKCRKMTLRLELVKRVDDQNTYNNWELGARIHKWSVLPQSEAKPQPDCIPKPIRDDYYEACSIRDLSPKASATLTRRVLQGMIRDFCKIQLKDNRLVAELRELRKQAETNTAARGVELDSVEAIDHVRGIGNIGAHMEADINVIVDVDPDEAQKLIELVELLFDEWYVASEARAERLRSIGVIAAEKKLAKKGPPANTAPDTTE
jgi:hypothetical protein